MEDSRDIEKLRGGLSNLYSHANLNLPDELLFLEEPGRVLIGGGPRFIREEFGAIVHHLLVYMGRALIYLVVRFPSLPETGKWLTRTETYLQSVAKLN